MIKLSFSAKPVKTPSLQVVFVKDDKKSPVLLNEDKALAPVLLRLHKEGVFSGKMAQVHFSENLSGVSVLWVGLGMGKEHPDHSRAEEARRLGGKVFKALAQTPSGGALFASLDKAAEHLSLKPAELVESLSLGVRLADFRFDEYKSKPKERKERAITLHLPAPGAEAALKRAEQLATAAINCRRLQATPPNVAFPAYMTKTARELVKGRNIKLKVYGKKELKDKKCVGLLTVGGGSQHDAQMLVLDYSPPGAKATLGLVGKAITFDTGGISLKPGAKMHEMKYDKSGGCAVLHAVAAAADLKLPYRIVGIVCAAENMPSGHAARPGDIITYRNGKSVEILNTDAEGRLVLADGLIEMGSFKPDVVLDLATLTGLCAMTFGPYTAGVMCNHQPLADALLASGLQSGERVWQLPLWEDYAEAIKGEHADIQNIGGPFGGTITAAHFLKNFVPKDTPWAHLDIAGVAWGNFKSAYIPSGPSGFGVRLLLDFLEQHGKDLPGFKKGFSKND